jgi:hypothetical protein
MKSESSIKKLDSRRNVEELPSTYVAKVREPEPFRPRSRRGLLYGAIAAVVIAPRAIARRIAKRAVDDLGKDRAIAHLPESAVSILPE